MNATPNQSPPQPEDLPSLGRLTLAAVLAVLVLIVLVITVVLPAERGIDSTGIGEKLNLTRIGLLKTAMAESDAAISGRPAQQDELSITLKAGAGREIKMNMKKGYVAQYTWAATGGVVLHDTHADLYDNEDIYISYSQADSVASDSGVITALFSGNHGWYWQNNGQADVIITLNTSGEYVDISVK